MRECAENVVIAHIRLSNVMKVINGGIQISLPPHNRRFWVNFSRGRPTWTSAIFQACFASGCAFCCNVRPEISRLCRLDWHRPLRPVADAIRRLDAIASRRNAAGHCRRTQGVARLADGAAAMTRASPAKSARASRSRKAPGDFTRRCWHDGMPKPRAPRSATCLPASPTCCAPRRW